MSGKIKVLTVQFDVTHLPQQAIDNLRLALEVQGEGIPEEIGGRDTYEAELLNASVREIEVEDT